MDILKSLEGDNKVGVEERAFVKELEKTEKFTEEEARNYLGIKNGIKLLIGNYPSLNGLLVEN